MSSTARVAMRTKLAFGAGAASESALGIAFNTFNLLFYNNVLGLSGTLCGLAVTLATVLDAISDPVVGSISDRWRSRLGRRHPFLYASILPMAVSFYCIYSPPAGLRGFPLFLWFTAFTVLMRQALTLYHVPHSALGAELSRDYRERSVVMAYNVIFGVVGGASTHFFAWTWFGRAAGGRDVAGNYRMLGLVVGLFAALIVFVSAHFTRDQIPRLVRPPANLPRFSAAQLGREVWTCLQNSNYLTLMLGLVFLSATLGVRETLGPYVNLFFWELTEDQIRFFGLATPPAFVVAFFVTPSLHGRFDKRGTMVAAVCGVVIGSSLPTILRLLGAFPATGSRPLFVALVGFVFLFYLSAAVLLITAMSALADIADEHELTTGRRQEGIFFAARTFFAKLVSAAGHLLGGVVLDVIAFPVGAKPGEVGARTAFQLGLVDGPLTAVPALVAIVFYMRYRIDKRRHSEIQAALDARPTPAFTPM
jgi:GPH family glycoside/pentoside/hexuronide:cation symporter